MESPLTDWSKTWTFGLSCLCGELFLDIWLKWRALNQLESRVIPGPRSGHMHKYLQTFMLMLVNSCLTWDWSGQFLQLLCSRNSSVGISCTATESYQLRISTTDSHSMEPKAFNGTTYCKLHFYINNAFSWGS